MNTEYSQGPIMDGYINNATYGAIDRLCTERKRLQLSQAEVARMLGVSRFTVNQYENYHTSLSLRYLIALQLHGFDSIYALTGERYPMPTITNTGPVLDQEDVYSLMLDHPAADGLRLNFDNLKLTAEYIYKQQLDLYGFCQLMALLTSIVKESIGNKATNSHVGDIE